jgi:hypothetical protein
MKHLLAALASALMLTAAPARADTRLTIDLRWENVPRTDASVRVSKQARVSEGSPRANVTYQLNESGLQILGIWYPEGFSCQAAIAKGDSMLVLHCGRPGGSYQLSKPYDGTVHLEWIEEAPGPANVSGLVVQ